MDRKEERTLAYHLATLIETTDYDAVAGGISIIIPTVHMTGDPLAPDLTKDH